ncbi:WD40/YVTN/BNR-like repeat-containing protein [Nitrosococcus oceani]|uniref:WD40/YVTN/BNR-like repeat-containing protein n=1 Tax=Nitrosococcus oceani TaxID=1229 RepID=UPI0004E89227|nr:glycosyl hydrolase [Nitrosococcus oceani]KFI23699.1 glycosyl hydrolase [Nitrosococcus oceani]
MRYVWIVLLLVATFGTASYGGKSAIHTEEVDPSVLPPIYVDEDEWGNLFRTSLTFDPESGTYTIEEVYLDEADIAELRAEGFRIGISPAEPSTTQAAPWRPLCPEEVSCVEPQIFMTPGRSELLPPALAPLVRTDSVWLQYSDKFKFEPYQNRPRGIFRLHPPQTALEILLPLKDSPLETPNPDPDSSDVDEVFDPPNIQPTYLNVSDFNAIEAEDGSTLVFGLYGMFRLSPEGELIDALNWAGRSIVGLNNAAFTGPPVRVQDSLFVGIRGAGGQYIYHSEDDGLTWQEQLASHRLGDDRYNLVANPEGTGLWAITSEFFDRPAELRESLDLGATWQRVDDGSFPAHTVRVVHDPGDPQVAYALSGQGLYRSEDRGVSWHLTALQEPVHGLAFVPQEAPLPPLLVAGTDTGVKVTPAPFSDWKAWKPLSNGLLAIPHTVVYTDGLLIGVSAAGYFVCPQTDCFGEGQVVPAEEARGEATVTEFFNVDLGHYFMTASPEDVATIEAGGAGPGWERTGHTFQAWSLLGSNVGVYLCRFYGSVSPGPNSHFFTPSPQECGLLRDLQAQTPPTAPRWNFEGYAFMAIPAQGKGEAQHCPEAFAPVYRAYNNGFARGEESNHRFVTDRTLLTPLVAGGWVEEGIAFCVPPQ